MPIIYKALTYSSTGSVLVPLAFAFLKWRRLNAPLRLISWLLIFSLLTDLASIVLVSNKMRTMPLINLYLLVQFVLVSALIYIQTGRERLIIIFSTIAILFFFIDLTFLLNPSTGITYGNAAFSAIGILYGVYYLKKLLDDLPFDDITKTPVFWAIFGILSFYCGTFFLILFDKLMSQYADFHRNAWILAPFSNITKNGLTAIALWLNWKNKN